MTRRDLQGLMPTHEPAAGLPRDAGSTDPSKFSQRRPGWLWAMLRSGSCTARSFAPRGVTS